jgi:hypothetical protein
MPSNGAIRYSENWKIVKKSHKISQTCDPIHEMETTIVQCRSRPTNKNQGANNKKGVQNHTLTKHNQILQSRDNKKADTDIQSWKTKTLQIPKESKTRKYDDHSDSGSKCPISENS